MGLNGVKWVYNGDHTGIVIHLMGYTSGNLLHSYGKWAI